MSPQLVGFHMSLRALKPQPHLIAKLRLSAPSTRLHDPTEGRCRAPKCSPTPHIRPHHPHPSAPSRVIDRRHGALALGCLFFFFSFFFSVPADSVAAAEGRRGGGACPVRRQQRRRADGCRRVAVSVGGRAARPVVVVASFLPSRTACPACCRSSVRVRASCPEQLVTACVDLGHAKESPFVRAAVRHRHLRAAGSCPAAGAMEPPEACSPDSAVCKSGRVYNDDVDVVDGEKSAHTEASESAAALLKRTPRLLCAAAATESRCKIWQIDRGGRARLARARRVHHKGHARADEADRSGTPLSGPRGHG
uniref:WD_REPEATS_REGION domain-containing protein n=1 Tax=Steinernema glaseri TaxID=37863 RepID=A0A1I8AK49_9BILA